MAEQVTEQVADPIRIIRSLPGFDGEFHAKPQEQQQKGLFPPTLTVSERSPTTTNEYKSIRLSEQAFTETDAHVALPAGNSEKLQTVGQAKQTNINIPLFLDAALQLLLEKDPEKLKKLTANIPGFPSEINITTFSPTAEGEVVIVFSNTEFSQHTHLIIEKSLVAQITNRQPNTLSKETPNPKIPVSTCYAFFTVADGSTTTASTPSCGTICQNHFSETVKHASSMTLGSRKTREKAKSQLQSQITHSKLFVQSKIQPSEEFLANIISYSISVHQPWYLRLSNGTNWGIQTTNVMREHVASAFAAHARFVDTGNIVGFLADLNKVKIAIEQDFTDNKLNFKTLNDSTLYTNVCTEINKITKELKLPPKFTNSLTSAFSLDAFGTQQDKATELQAAINFIKNNKEITLTTLELLLNLQNQKTQTNNAPTTLAIFESLIEYLNKKPSGNTVQQTAITKLKNQLASALVDVYERSSAKERTIIQPPPAATTESIRNTLQKSLFKADLRQTLNDLAQAVSTAKQPNSTPQQKQKAEEIETLLMSDIKTKYTSKNSEILTKQAIRTVIHEIVQDATKMSDEDDRVQWLLNIMPFLNLYSTFLKDQDEDSAPQAKETAIILVNKIITKKINAIKTNTSLLELLKSPIFSQLPSECYDIAVLNINHILNSKDIFSASPSKDLQANIETWNSLASIAPDKQERQLEIICGRTNLGLLLKTAYFHNLTQAYIRKLFAENNFTKISILLEQKQEHVLSLPPLSTKEGAVETNFFNKDQILNELLALLETKLTDKTQTIPFESITTGTLMSQLISRAQALLTLDPKNQTARIFLQAVDDSIVTALSAKLAEPIDKSQNMTIEEISKAIDARATEFIDTSSTIKAREPHLQEQIKNGKDMAVVNARAQIIQNFMVKVKDNPAQNNLDTLYKQLGIVTVGTADGTAGVTVEQTQQRLQEILKETNEKCQANVKKGLQEATFEALKPILANNIKQQLECKDTNTPLAASENSRIDFDLLQLVNKIAINVQNTSTNITKSVGSYIEIANKIIANNLTLTPNQAIPAFLDPADTTLGTANSTVNALVTAYRLINMFGSEEQKQKAQKTLQEAFDHYIKTIVSTSPDKISADWKVRVKTTLELISQDMDPLSAEILSKEPKDPKTGQPDPVACRIYYADLLSSSPPPPATNLNFFIHQQLETANKDAKDEAKKLTYEQRIALQAKIAITILMHPELKLKDSIPLLFNTAEITDPTKQPLEAAKLVIETLDYLLQVYVTEYPDLKKQAELLKQQPPCLETARVRFKVPKNKFELNQTNVDNPPLPLPPPWIDSHIFYGDKDTATQTFSPFTINKGTQIISPKAIQGLNTWIANRYTIELTGNLNAICNDAKTSYDFVSRVDAIVSTMNQDSGTTEEEGTVTRTVGWAKHLKMIAKCADKTHKESLITAIDNLIARLKNIAVRLDPPYNGVDDVLKVIANLEQARFNLLHPSASKEEKDNNHAHCKSQLILILLDRILTISLQVDAETSGKINQRLILIQNKMLAANNDFTPSEKFALHSKLLSILQNGNKKQIEAATVIINSIFGSVETLNNIFIASIKSQLSKEGTEVSQLTTPPSDFRDAFAYYAESQITQKPETTTTVPRATTEAESAFILEIKTKVKPDSISIGQKITIGNDTFTVIQTDQNTVVCSKTTGDKQTKITLSNTQKSGISITVETTSKTTIEKQGELSCVVLTNTSQKYTPKKWSANTIEETTTSTTYDLTALNKLKAELTPPPPQEKASVYQLEIATTCKEVCMGLSMAAAKDPKTSITHPTTIAPPPTELPTGSKKAMATLASCSVKEKNLPPTPEPSVSSYGVDGFFVP